MKAGPALSMLCTKNEYHHKVPQVSLLLVLSLLPHQIMGTVTTTGTKMNTRCKNLRPVQSGSQT
jgi:hypothetical protein